MASFFRQFNAIGPLFCSFVQHPEPRKHRIPGFFHSDFFRHYVTFLEFFWIPPKGLPFVCFDILQHNGCQKIPKGPPFTFFGTVTLFKNLILYFFPEIFKNLPRFPLYFFSYFATNWSFTKLKALLQF